MGIPKYDAFYEPLLKSLQDGEVHALAEVKETVAQAMQLSEEARKELLPSGKQTVYANRIGWAKTYLQKAGLLTATKRAHFQITAEGTKLLNSGEAITNDLLAARYPGFAAFVGKDTNSDTAANPVVHTEETPQETLERMYQVINQQLAEDLLTEIMNQPPVFFENLVVDLMKAMNYGDGVVTRASGDGGIDGIISEDRLGFSQIYIQAKRYEPHKSVHRPDIQKFAGAMMGPPRIEKGLFITTAHFSPGAREFAEAQHIILVDGQKLTELMMEYNLGVSTQKTYCVKRIDSDYFADMQ